MILNKSFLVLTFNSWDFETEVAGYNSDQEYYHEKKKSDIFEHAFSKKISENDVFGMKRTS